MYKIITDIYTSEFDDFNALYEYVDAKRKKDNMPAWIVLEGLSVKQRTRIKNDLLWRPPMYWVVDGVLYGQLKYPRVKLAWRLGLKAGGVYKR